MEIEGRKVYQLIDANGKYRSTVTFKGVHVDFISKERREAIVYTYDQARLLAHYYIKEKNIPVMIECRRVYSKTEI